MKELAERDATGELATIYAEIRHLCGVPYVSSMQRHLATRPGWLEWAWTAIRPAFASGVAQTSAWRAVDARPALRVPHISRAALRVFGVDDAGEASVRAVCDSFYRASPTNLVFSGLLRRLLTGDRPVGNASDDAKWTPPDALPPLPALVDVTTLPAAERGVLLSVSTPVDGQPFVPGLYRMLAQWPAFMAHVSTTLPPHFVASETHAMCAALLRAIDAEIPRVFAALPRLPAQPAAPPAREHAGVLAALDAYRKTSPEMILFSRAIRDALPNDDCAPAA